LLLSASIVYGLGVSALYVRERASARLERSSRLESERELRSSNALNEFLIARILAPPTEVDPTSILLHDVVQAAAGRIALERALKDEPLVRADLHEAIGQWLAECDACRDQAKEHAGWCRHLRDRHGNAAEAAGWELEDPGPFGQP
jgi:hypothetical protein